MSDTNMDFTCWYLHEPKVLQVLPADLGRHISASLLPAVRTAQLKHALVSWAQASKVDTLEKLLIAEKATPGTFFFVVATFSSRGLKGYMHGKSWVKPLPTLRAEVAIAGVQHLLEVKFNPDHFTGASSLTYVRGTNKRLLVLGLVDSKADNNISGIAYAIGTPVNEYGTEYGAPRWPLANLEIHPEDIDSFSRMKSEPSPHEAELDQLKAVPEGQIKRAIANILGERNVPHDWGGERSDLFSAELVLNGRKLTAAFLLKGPACFEPMLPKHLGKNGDQIDRLFSEPASLLILQHCHFVKPSVRSQMRAFAGQFWNPRQYCVVDGLNTLRLLRAYSQCGFNPSPA